MAAYSLVYDSRHLQAAKNRNQLRNPTLGNRVWAIFTFTLRLREALPFDTVKDDGHQSETAIGD